MVVCAPTAMSSKPRSRFDAVRQFLGADIPVAQADRSTSMQVIVQCAPWVRGSVVMPAIRKVGNQFALAFLAFVSLGTWFGTGAVSAEEECVPHCDYRHYYGPFDFTYVQPGLFGYPLCGPQGNCSPRLVYSTTGFRRGRITVRFPRLTAVRP
jgi:hypothetical protein